MDGCGNSQDDILVMAATNTPWKLDEAFRRRFENRIYIHLPEESSRAYIFKKKIKEVPNNLSEEDFMLLAEASEMYSVPISKQYQKKLCSCQ